MTNPLECRPVSRMDRAIAILDRLFSGRRDTYAIFTPGPDGRGVKYSGKRLDRDLTPEVMRAHVVGEEPIGVYPLTRSGDEWVSSWGCIDIDQNRVPGKALSIATAIAEAGESKLCDVVHVYTEITKSEQAHVWYFFEEPTAAWKVRAIGRLMAEVAGFKPYKSKHSDDEIVICPAADTAPAKDKDGRGGVGMCVYIPWFGKNARQGRQVFMDPGTGRPFEDQVGAMEAAHFISPATVAALIDQHDMKPENVTPIRPKPDDDKFVPKAPAGTIPALTDTEFANLCVKLKTLRSMRETPTTCSYSDWFAGMMHLVPFADGQERAHALSRLDSARYDANITERQWRHAVTLYSREDSQPEARVSQKIVDFWRAGGRPDITPIAPLWAIWNGCFCRRKFESNGTEKDPSPITNFTATVICEEYIDDGTGNRERCVRMRGSLMTGQPLPEISVPTKDWTTIKTWLHKGWGFRPVVYGEERHVLQCISLCGQEAPERTQYTHTGWANGAAGKLMFLTPHGPRGTDVSQSAFDEIARVAAPEKLKGYCIPETATEHQVREAFAWIERFLDCGKLEATAPLMAAMFLAPLSSFLNLDFALFLTGHTGSHKSSLVAAAMAVWGPRWSKDTLPLSFNATANAMEAMAFHAKDLPLPIDNYVPNVKGTGQDVLKRISHSFADHSGRDRMNARAELVAAKPFRSFCIITGEDVPYGAGAGATNRYYIVPMQRDTLRLVDLEAVQEAGWSGRMAPAMTHYLGYLTKKMEDPEWIGKIVAYQYRLEKEARRAAAGREHDRLTSQTAWMRTGLELIRRCHPMGNWVDPSLADRLSFAFNSAIQQRRMMSAEASLSYRFLSSVAYLVQCGKLHGVEVKKDIEGKLVNRAPLNQFASQICGWTATEYAPFWMLNHRDSRLAMWISDCDDEGGIREASLCFRGDEIVTEIKQCLRAECPIAEGARGISQALISDGILRRTPGSDRLGSRMQLAAGTPEVTVWKLSLSKVLQTLGWVDEEVAPPQ